MPKTTNDPSIPDRTNDIKENIKTRRLNSYLFGSTKRVSEIISMKSQSVNFKEETVMGTYRTLDSKVLKQTGRAKKYQHALSEDEMCNESAVVLGNLIITFFHALKRFNKDNKNCETFRLKFPEKPKSSIHSINRIAIATTDLILAIFQPRKDLWRILNSIEFFLKTPFDGLDASYTFKKLFLFFDEKDSFIVEIICIKNFYKVPHNEIIIHRTKNLSSNISGQIKGLVKNYKCDLSENNLLDKFKSDNRLLSSYYWVKDWIQREMLGIKINPNQRHSKNKLPELTIFNEMEKNLGADNTFKLSQLIGSAAIEASWKDIESIKDPQSKYGSLSLMNRR
jgi:hypothetical protein